MSQRGLNPRPKYWLLFEIAADGTSKQIAAHDHFDMLLPTSTSNQFYRLGFGTEIKNARYEEHFDDLTGHDFGVIVPKDADEDFYEKNKERLDSLKYQQNQVLGIKYHVPSKSLVSGNTWRQYNNLKADMPNRVQNTKYVDRVEINTWSWTGENDYGIGFSQLYIGDYQVLTKSYSSYILDLDKISKEFDGFPRKQERAIEQLQENPYSFKKLLPEYDYHDYLKLVTYPEREYILVTEKK